jgi:hypothetical protein
VVSMQPDSISAAARIPNFAWSDDIALFQLISGARNALTLARKAHDSAKPIIAKICRRSSA